MGVLTREVETAETVERVITEVAIPALPIAPEVTPEAPQRPYHAIAEILRKAHGVVPKMEGFLHRAGQGYCAMGVLAKHMGYSDADLEGAACPGEEVLEHYGLTEGMADTIMTANDGLGSTHVGAQSFADIADWLDKISGED